MMNESSTTIFTFNDWYRGDVTLEFATYVFEKGNKPIIVKWSNFQESDENEIKDIQKRIFDENVSSLLEEYKKQFLSRLKKSEMKATFLRYEIQESEKVMFGAIPNIELISFDHWGILLEYQYLTDLQYYINRTIKNGNDDGYGFVHSPNNKFQDKRRPDYRIYGRFLWEYTKWLKSLNSLEKKLKNYDKIKNKNWFMVGLAIADGSIERLLINNKLSYRAIARELGNEDGYSPYISASIANSRISDKNIFSNEMHIQQIIEYCNSNNIFIVDSFHRRVLESKEIKR